LTSQGPPQLSEFAELVKRCCAAIEGATGEPIDLRTVRGLLAEIYFRALDLPNLDSGDVVDPSPALPPLDKSISDRLASMPISEYWEVFDPLDANNHEADFRLIADDLLEIWRDLREGLILFETGKALEANWDWKEGFSTHWGNHLLCALRAIHSREEGY
jgi:hypothetical protein